MTKEEILLHFKNTKRHDGYYSALCPVHDDHDPSLAIYFNKDWATVKCFTGCDTDSILKSVGLRKKDLCLKECTSMYNQKSYGRTEYSYYDEKGNVAYKKYRIEKPDGSKTFRFEQPDGTPNIKGVKRYPYNLPAVLKADTVYFVEGEKCADAVNKTGYTATTLDSGSNSTWKSDYNDYFRNKRVIIVPDNDEPGEKYAMKLAKRIPGAKIIRLPGLAEKEDIFDWLQTGHLMTEIETMLETTDEVQTTEEEDQPEKVDLEFSSDRRPQSEILLDIIKQAGVELFLNENNDPFVSLQIDDHKEYHGIGSKEFSLWAQRSFYKSTGKTIRRESLVQVVDLLTGNAKFEDSRIFHLENRVALKDNAIWYDLTNKDWSAIRINADGWTVERDVPKLFCRYRHQAPQVLPKKGGDLTKIFHYINMTRFQTLFLCWLVSCYVPDIPHAMPIFYGEKGAAKSTACVLTKRMIDPSVMATLSLCKDEKSLIVSLQQHYYLPFDNVSAISNDSSDILCRAITGGAIQQRKLHTNGEDYIFSFNRCLALNGINNVANRADLLDRAILFELERVPENKRKELKEIYASFEEDRPLFLGVIFDTLTKAMKIYPTVKLDKLPRMADFCRWGYAIAEALGLSGEVFLKEYKENQKIQNDEAINADLVSSLLVEFLSRNITWSGRISSLYQELINEAEKQGISKNNKNLPQAPNHLSRRLNSMRSNLEDAGISFELNKKHSDGTYITIKKDLPPFAPARINPVDILGFSNGDTIVDRIHSADVSSSQEAFDSNENGANGDNEDENVTF